MSESRQRVYLTQCPRNLYARGGELIDPPDSYSLHEVQDIIMLSIIHNWTRVLLCRKGSDIKVTKFGGCGRSPHNGSTSQGKNFHGKPPSTRLGQESRRYKSQPIRCQGGAERWGRKEWLVEHCQCINLDLFVVYNSFNYKAIVYLMDYDSIEHMK